MPKRVYSLATVERVCELLTYDPDTGVMRWRITRPGRGCIAGREVGCKNTMGYLVVRVDGVLYYLHTLAWVLMNGEWPSNEIDHADTVEGNNRWANLRLSDRSGNCQNQKMPSTNTSGFKGVSLYKPNGKWHAQVVANKKHHSLGYYFTKEEAYAAYCEGAKRLHGEFARVT